MNLLDRLAYDTGGYTVQEILSSFCNKILEIIDLVNKHEEVCDEAHTLIENIRNEVVPDLVDDIMKELQDTGYFNNLVNVTLIEQLRTEVTTLLNDTITDYTTRLDNFDSQLDNNTKYVNVLSKKDGIKTDTQIFKETIQEAYDKSINITGWRSPLVIEIPSGEYRINDTIIDVNLNIEGGRFVFRGQGYQNTKIIFTPETEKFLIENKAIFGFTTFEGITFESNNIGKFMNAVGGGSGNCQSFTFEKCKFENFKNIITVTGGTMCSEVTFRDCKINGGDNDSILFNLNNSQAVNWRFFATDIEAFNGILFNYLAGTSISYYQGSIIPINNGIVMNIDGNANPNLFGEGNAPLLNANGVRFEMRDNSKLINVIEAHSFVTAQFTCCGMGGDNIETDKFICNLKLNNRIIFDNCYNLNNYKFKHTINENAYVYESYIEFRNVCPNNILENSSVNVVNNIKGNPIYNFINCGINGSTRLGEKSACSRTLLTTSRHLIEFNENKKPVFNNIAVDTPFTLEYEIKGIYLCSLGLHIEKAWTGGYGDMTFDVKVYNGDKSIMYCNGTLESSKGISLTSNNIFKSIDDDKIIIEFTPKSIWGSTFSCIPHLIFEY